MPRDRPLVTVVSGAQGMRIAAASMAAQGLGIAPGRTLADARALVPDLRTVPADPAADVAALTQLCGWCSRYTPMAAIDRQDQGGAAGLLLDITGCAHLFGGEAAMIDDIIARLSACGFAARAGVADTSGAAWAWARFGDTAILPPGHQRARLAGLPVAGLRLGADTRHALDGLGLRRIGDLYALPRAALAARFGLEAVRRLDQALGDEPEPIAPRRPPPSHHRVLAFAEPISTPESIAAAVQALVKGLCDELAAQRLGARRLELTVCRSDATTLGLAAGANQPTRDPTHVFRLFQQVLDRIDPGFGIDAIALAARATAPLALQQHALADDAARASDIDLASLYDVLGMRLGYAYVMRLAARASHVPERAVARVPPGEPVDASPWPAHWERPLRLLPRPQPVAVVAPVPDGPPLRFVWDGITHPVVHAEGPERIAGEWWRERAAFRDYYQVEDSAGRRYWLFREGAYGPEGARWFLHGLFA